MTKALLNRGFARLGFAGLALAATSLAVAAEGTPTDPLRPLSECLDPQHARGWAIVDGDDIVVDAGRRKFLIHFSASCPDLNWTRALQFRTAGGSSRLCGHANEAVLPNDKGGMATACSIASITSIDTARYKALTTDSPGKDDATAAVDGKPD